MNMKKILLSTLALLCIVFSSSAQSIDKFTGALLWKISGNGLNQPSYILGTHHLASVHFVDEIPGLRDAMDNTQQVAGELVMNDKMELQNKVMQSAMLPIGQSYKDILSESNYNTLDEGLKKILGAGLDQMGTFKPGVISMSLAVIAFSKAYPDINIMTHVSIDEHIQKVAAEHNKPVLGLETVEDQIYAMFEAEPLEAQSKQLVCSVSNFDFAVESVKQLTSYYYEGKLPQMYDLSFNNPEEPCPSSDDSKNSLLRNRNDNWLKKLPQMMSDKSTLVAVGALHLAGEEGLLYQLDKMGYTVEKVGQN